MRIMRASKRARADYFLLACRQSASFSSSDNARKPSPAVSSLLRKRRSNLALAKRSACSESNFQRLARFTTANRRSPISYSLCASYEAPLTIPEKRRGGKDGCRQFYSLLLYY